MKSCTSSRHFMILNAKLSITINSNEKTNPITHSEKIIFAKTTRIIEIGINKK